MSFKARSFDVTTFDKLVDDQSTKDFQAMYESLRIQTKKFLATSLLGQIYTNCLLLLSALSCFQYIVQTYLNEDYSGEEVVNVIFQFTL